MASNSPNSVQARDNLTRICEEHLKGRFKIETVDVLRDAATAYKSHVLLTPMLVLMKPRPKVSILGNLGETKQVLAMLRLI